MTTQLETPREGYDEHNNKSSLSVKLRFIEPVGERTNFRRLMLASFATAPDNLYMAPHPRRSLAPAATWNLHTTQPSTFSQLTGGCQSHRFAVNKGLSVSSGKR
jgi:hypothetical protein